MSDQGDARIGDLRQSTVTLPQAAEILHLGVNQVRKAIDRHVVTPSFTLQGRRQVRTLDGVDLLCLRMRHSLQPPVRQQLYARLKQAPARESLKQVFHIAVPPSNLGDAATTAVWVYELATETLQNIASVKELSQLVDDVGNLSGTDIQAARIAALVTGGMTVEEIMRDYPTLTRQQIEVACAYDRAHPKQGRPYPSRTVKSVLRDGGGGGLAAAFALSRSDEAEAASDTP